MTFFRKPDHPSAPRPATRRENGCGRLAIAAAAGMALAASPALAASGEPKTAEYAIRWNARDGGPVTINDVLAIFKTRATRVRQFKNDYYDLPPTISAPPGFSVIVRRRVDEGAQSELTWKLRGDHALAEWACPLREVKQSKAEVDVNFSGDGATTRAFSYSCTSNAADAEASALSAKLRSCPATVFRRDAGNLKIEEWHLPGDLLVIEVSMTSEDGPVAMDFFRTSVAAPLFAAGVIPLNESKTELGSRCP
jgi:hypothetical protein